MLDIRHPASSQDQRVSQWVFDACPGQISARNDAGKLLMAISISPQFGPRLAAAFSALADGSVRRVDAFGGAGLQYTWRASLALASR